MCQGGSIPLSNQPQYEHKHPDTALCLCTDNEGQDISWQLPTACTQVLLPRQLSAYDATMVRGRKSLPADMLCRSNWQRSRCHTPNMASQPQNTRPNNMPPQRLEWAPQPGGPWWLLVACKDCNWEGINTCLVTNDVHSKAQHMTSLEARHFGSPRCIRDTTAFHCFGRSSMRQQPSGHGYMCAWLPDNILTWFCLLLHSVRPSTTAPFHSGYHIEGINFDSFNVGISAWTKPLTWNKMPCSPCTVFLNKALYYCSAKHLGRTKWFP